MNLCSHCGRETRYSLRGEYQHKGECPPAPEETLEPTTWADVEIPGPDEDEEITEMPTDPWPSISMSVQRVTAGSSLDPPQSATTQRSARGAAKRATK